MSSSSTSSLPYSYRSRDVSDLMGRKKGGKRDEGKDDGPAVNVTELRGTVNAYFKEHITASIERLKRDLSAINAGKANPDLLARVVVEAYGAKQPLVKVAQVATKDSQTLMVNVFDPSLTKAVADAIRDAELQLNPQVMGSQVKVPVPRVTQEYRDKLAKQVGEAGEAAKVAVRKHRHDALAVARKAKESLSKDDMFALEEELTKQTKAAEKQIQEACEKKAKEVTKGD